MNTNNYNCTFAVNSTPEEVFQSINNVKEWWSQNIIGSTKHVNDVFTVDFGETFVTFKITEMLPDKKVVWNVTGCYLHWLKDKEEWKNTEVVFEIEPIANGTQLSMTHIGLTPAVECYEGCEKGWNTYAGESLRKLITEKKGMPQPAKVQTEKVNN